MQIKVFVGSEFWTLEILLPFIEIWDATLHIKRIEANEACLVWLFRSTFYILFVQA
jgi:hypothetical protein